MVDNTVVGELVDSTVAYLSPVLRDLLHATEGEEVDASILSEMFKDWTGVVSNCLIDTLHGGMLLGEYDHELFDEHCKQLIDVGAALITYSLLMRYSAFFNIKGSDYIKLVHSDKTYKAAQTRAAHLRPRSGEEAPLLALEGTVEAVQRVLQDAVRGTSGFKVERPGLLRDYEESQQKSSEYPLRNEQTHEWQDCYAPAPTVTSGITPAPVLIEDDLDRPHFFMPLINDAIQTTVVTERQLRNEQADEWHAAEQDEVVERMRGDF